ncbi:MAG: adenylate kinase [Sulfurimonas sp.]|nr:MAG: adenylate kinase [Sulfurimonas sp.]
MKKLILIIGAPGSGKTTDAELIAQHHAQHISHYSTGDMLRAEAASGSDRGNIIESYISKGNIVPIDIVIETIVHAIKKAATPAVILDGYPRSIEQMEALEHYMQHHHDVTLVSVIEVHVSDAVAHERVVGRARGADDCHDIFERRMTIYKEPLAAIEAFYRRKNLLHVIDGERSIDIVVAEMETYIMSKLS